MWPGNSFGCAGSPGSRIGGGTSGRGSPGGLSCGGSDGFPGLIGGSSCGSIGIPPHPEFHPVRQRRGGGNVPRQWRQSVFKRSGNRFASRKRVKTRLYARSKSVLLRVLPVSA
jgi:hypothetical protein